MLSDFSTLTVQLGTLPLSESESRQGVEKGK